MVAGAAAMLHLQERVNLVLNRIAFMQQCFMPLNLHTPMQVYLSFPEDLVQSVLT